MWLLYIVMSCRKASPSPVTGCANTWQDVLLMKANPLIPNQPNEFRKSHTHKDWLIMSKKRKEMPPSNPSYLRTPSCVSMATLAQPLTDFSPSVYQFKQRWLPTKYRIIRTNADGGFPVVFLLPCYLFLFLGSYTLWPVPLKPSSLGGRKQQTHPRWGMVCLLLVACFFSLLSYLWSQLFIFERKILSFKSYTVLPTWFRPSKDSQGSDSSVSVMNLDVFVE